jgi:nucleotide-binding universal stress UspA family protein
MFKHILIPSDGSDLSRKALAGGSAFARSIGARITVVTVSSPFHVVAIDPVMVTDTKAEYLADAEASARKRLKEAEDLVRAADVRCETRHAFSDHPYQAIIEAARGADCDLILMASHGRRGVVGTLLGSETQKVLTHTKIPVLVWR